MVQHLTIGIISLITALGLAAIAAFFSISGLAALFAAEMMAVIIMATGLEVAKLVITAWLKYNWNSSPFILKSYLTSAVVALMFITSLGIFGFLSKGHIEQEVPLAQVELKIKNIDQKIAIENKRIESQNRIIHASEQREIQLDGIVQTLIDAQRIRGASGATATRANQADERNEIKNTISKARQDIETIMARISNLEAKKIEIRTANAAVEAKLGPVKYVAEIVGVDDTGAAVRFVIFIIMFAFDPVAVILIIAALISFKEASLIRELNERERKKALEIEEQARIEAERLEKEHEEALQKEERELKRQEIAAQEQLNNERVKELEAELERVHRLEKELAELKAPTIEPVDAEEVEDIKEDEPITDDIAIKLDKMLETMKQDSIATTLDKTNINDVVMVKPVEIKADDVENIEHHFEKASAVKEIVEEGVCQECLCIPCACDEDLEEDWGEIAELVADKVDHEEFETDQDRLDRIQELLDQMTGVELKPNELINEENGIDETEVLRQFITEREELADDEVEAVEEEYNISEMENDLKSVSERFDRVGEVLQQQIEDSGEYEYVDNRATPFNTHGEELSRIMTNAVLNAHNSNDTAEELLEETIDEIVEDDRFDWDSLKGKQNSFDFEVSDSDDNEVEDDEPELFVESSDRFQESETQSEQEPSEEPKVSGENIKEVSLADIDLENVDLAELVKTNPEFLEEFRNIVIKNINDITPDEAKEIEKVLSAAEEPEPRREWINKKVG